MLIRLLPQAEIIIGEDSGFYAKGKDGEKGKKLKKAEITLNDCLACSCVDASRPFRWPARFPRLATDSYARVTRRGCITSAESVLVSMQSHEEVYRVLREQPVRPSFRQARLSYTADTTFCTPCGLVQDLTPILSVSPQSVASLAALYDLSLAQAMRGMRVFFKQHLGFRCVRR